MTLTIIHTAICKRKNFVYVLCLRFVYTLNRCKSIYKQLCKQCKQKNVYN